MFQIFVAKETEVSHDEITKKFQIDDRKALELDDSKFKPFGSLEDSANSLINQYNEQNTSWEDMASEETSWNELDANLQAIRRETRQQRLREHQEQVKSKKLQNK